MKKIIILLLIFFSLSIWADDSKKETIGQKIKVNIICVKQLSDPEKDHLPFIIWCVNNKKYMMMAGGYMSKMDEPCDCDSGI